MNKGLSWLVYGLAMCLAWWSITEADHQAWWFGLTLIVPLTFWWAWRFPLPNWHWRELPGLVVLFMQQTWLGSWDVAKRAFKPNYQVEPCVLQYSLNLDSDALCQVWIAMIGLFPGTLSVAVQGREVTVHVLDRNLAVYQALQNLECRLQRLNGQEEAHV